MTAITFYFQVHQPYRLRRYTFFDIGKRHEYFDDPENKRILERVAERCYLPMNAILLKEIERTKGKFRCAFSLSGTVLDQLEEWAPEALQSFVDLAETGSVEFLCETSHHSMSFMGDTEEWAEQIVNHRKRIRELFGKRPTTFRNTELVIDNHIARALEDLHFEALLGEGADPLLGARKPTEVYGVKGCEKLQLLLRSYEYSDDIAFRFSNKEWPEYPLLADTFAKWLDRVPAKAPFIGLFVDYETFGEHQWAETGILDFMEFLPRFVLQNERFEFRTPKQVARKHAAAEKLDIPRPISWADAERDLSAWLGNHMQRAAHEAVYELGPDVKRAAKLGHTKLLDDWRKLTTSDHTYYMATKHRSDNEVHEYFSPYDTPHDAFITFMNVVEDLSAEVQRALAGGEGVTLQPQAKPASRVSGRKR